MEDKEEILKFTSSVIMLSKLLARIEDRFLIRKLYEKISDIVAKFIVFQSPATASHNISRQNLINVIDNLLDYMEYLTHDSKLDTTPLLIAQKNLLKFKLSVLRRRKLNKTTGTDIKSADGNVPVSAVNKVKSGSKIRNENLLLKLNSSKDKIFNFIKKFPETRTKEIIDEFSALSGRTVKRNLKELVDEGLLMKKVEGNAVYYLVLSI